MAYTVAITNQKGGVGKTTTAVNLAAAIAIAERRTLLVDADPQGNTTSGVGIAKLELQVSLYDVLVEGHPVQDVILPVPGLPFLSLLPATQDLVGAELQLVERPFRESALRRVLEPIEGDYDYIIVDCPPSLGLLTLNVLAAVQAVIIPIQCEYYGLEGISQLLNTVRLVQQNINPGLAIGGVLLLSTTGRLGTDPGDLISQGWPWLLVAVGVWFLIGAVAPGSSGPTERLSIALRGAPDASVKIRFGAGTLTTHVAPSGVLVDGTFEGGVVTRELGPGRVELEQDTSYGLPWLDRRSAWDVGLPTDVPLALRAETGAARATLDLRGVRLRRLDLQTGASETRVILPRNAGFSEVRAEHGAASLTFEVPAGVAARIRARMAIGSNQIDETRFPRVGDVYQSADYDTATERVDLDIQGGVGSLRVISGN